VSLVQGEGCCFEEAPEYHQRSEAGVFGLSEGVGELVRGSVLLLIGLAAEVPLMILKRAKTGFRVAVMLALESPAMPICAFVSRMFVVMTRTLIGRLIGTAI